jgi:hypothetical protein
MSKFTDTVRPSVDGADYNSWKYHMNLMVSGKYSEAISSDAFECMRAMRSIINDLSLSDISSNIENFVYFPVIIEPESSIAQTKMRYYSKKDSCEFVNVEIPIEEWASASNRKKMWLLWNGLVNAVCSTKNTKLSENVKRELIIRISKATGLTFQKTLS